MDWTELPQDIQEWAVVSRVKKLLLCLSTSWKRMGGGGADVYLHSFLTSVLDGGERPASRYHFTPRKEPPYTLTRRLGGPQSPSERFWREKSLASVGIRVVCEKEVNFVTGWAILAFLLSTVSVGLIASFQNSIRLSCWSHIKAAIVSTWAVELWRCLWICRRMPSII